MSGFPKKAKWVISRYECERNDKLLKLVRGLEQAQLELKVRVSELEKKVRRGVHKSYVF